MDMVKPDTQTVLAVACDLWPKLYWSDNQDIIDELELTCKARYITGKRGLLRVQFDIYSGIHCSMSLGSHVLLEGATYASIEDAIATARRVLNEEIANLKGSL